MVRTPRPLHPTCHRNITRAVRRLRAANDAVHQLWAEMSVVGLMASSQEGAMPSLDFIAKWENAQARVEAETRTLAVVCEMHWPHDGGDARNAAA